MKTISLRPTDVERDFGQIAELFSLVQDEPTAEPALKADYEEVKARIIRLTAAEDEQGQLLGFNWATRSRTKPEQATIYVIVRPERRGQGVGRLLYADVEQAARAEHIRLLRLEIRDTCAECRAFADRRGFSEHTHQIGMTLDLEGFDDRPYDEIIARLRGEGFQFTSMEALGNTEEAQRKLYALNDDAAADTLGSDGEHPWLSFEDFQTKVCQSNWYIPAAQLVVIDTASGDWAAMSAITRFEGTNYAYNLFTGVDRRYRGRKLAQAVKVLALRCARQALAVSEVRTHHNAHNAPMIAIDVKLGYVQTPGLYTMEKNLG